MNTVQGLDMVDIDVTVAGDGVTVQNATAIGFDMLAANDVIHVVDAILAP